MGQGAAEPQDDGWELSAEAALRGFTPRCPQCEYDLTGLGLEEHCPECGAEYSLAALLAAETAKRRKEQNREPPKFLHAPLAAAVSLSLAPPLWMPEESVQVATCGFVAVLMAIWVRRAAWQILHRNPLLLLWVVIPIVRLVVPIGFSLGPFMTAGAAILIVGLVIAWVYWQEPQRTFGVLATVFLAPGLVLGGAMTLDGLVGVANGSYWSSFEYPFWQSSSSLWRPQQSGIASGAVLVIGVCVLGVWLCLTALAVPIYRRLAPAAPAPTAPLTQVAAGTSSVAHDEPERE